MTVALLFLLNALPLLALPLTDRVALIALAAFFSGSTSGYAAAVWETTLQERVPAEALSRVSSYDWLGSMAFLPLGYALVGPLAAWIGLETVLIIGAATQSVSVPLLLSVASIREIGDRGLHCRGQSAGGSDATTASRVETVCVNGSQPCRSIW